MPGTSRMVRCVAACHETSAGAVATNATALTPAPPLAVLPPPHCMSAGSALSASSMDGAASTAPVAASTIAIDEPAAKKRKTRADGCACHAKVFRDDTRNETSDCDTVNDQKNHAHKNQK